MKKPGLTYYTNIPTPYQVSFFKELAKLFELRVIFFAATEANRQWDFTINEGYEVVILKNNFIARFFQRWVVDFHFSWRIFSVALKDKSENIIVGCGYWTPNSLISLLIGRMRSKKIAYFSEALFSAKNKFVHGVKWIFLRTLNICCHAIFCTGKKACLSFEKYGVHKQKFIIPYSINPADFQDLNGQSLTLLKDQFKANNEIIILSSGSLIERKGMDVLIKAFTSIDINNARLVILGDGPQKEYLQRLAGNDERIIFAGFQAPDKIPYFFTIADIFAFASRYDGWGVVINEAIAANLPVISSDQVGAAVELINSPENGIICGSDNIEAFKAAMEYLLFNVDKRQEIKKKVHELVPLISSQYYANRVYSIFHHQLN